MAAIGTAPAREVALPAQGTENFEKYLIPAETFITGSEMKTGPGGKKFLVVTLSDDSEWVVVAHEPKQRFMGYLFLEQSLDGDDDLKAAENRWIKNGDQTLLLSRYYFRDPRITIPFQKKLGDIGFNGGKLTESEGVFYVHDTELVSFDPSKLEKIEAFSGKCDQIMETLEARSDSSQKFELEIPEGLKSRRRYRVLECVGQG